MVYLPVNLDFIPSIALYHCTEICWRMRFYIKLMARDNRLIVFHGKGCIGNWLMKFVDNWPSLFIVFRYLSIFSTADHYNK